MLKYFKIILSAILLIFFYQFALSQEEIWFAKGENAFNKNNFKEAVEAFTEFINLEPENEDAFYYRGLSYLYLQDAALARKDFSKVIELNPENADAYNNRGLCRGYMEDIYGAMDDFSKAIELDSNFSHAYLNLGSALLSDNQFERALPYLDKVVELDSTNPENYFIRGTVHYYIRNFKEAVDDFTKSLNLGLILDKTYFNRANSYYKLGKFQKALNDFDKLLEMDNEDVEALINRAAIYEQMGLEELAKKDKLEIDLIKSGINRMPDIDSLSFKRFSLVDGKVSVMLPDTWFSITDTAGEGEVMIITKDSVNEISELYHIGVRVAHEDNMNQKFQTETNEDLLKFWEYNQEANSKEYKEYKVLSRNEFQLADYTGYIKEVNILYNQEAYPIRLYEIILVKPDNLFYSYMQCPEAKFDYYKQIFQKAIKSLKIEI
jgi:tetratricopeptide (TPR) repeat protein